MALTIYVVPEELRLRRVSLEILPGQLVLKLLHFASGRHLGHLLEFEDRLADLEDELLDTATDGAMKEMVMYRSRLRKLRRVFNYHLQLAESIYKTGSPHLAGRRQTQPVIRAAMSMTAVRPY